MADWSVSLVQRLLAYLVLLAPPVWGQLSQSYKISTLAGGALPPLPAPALGIPVGYTTGVTADGLGNFYVSDPSLSSVFKVNATGIATIFAGTGRIGYSGDGGPAASAQLYSPAGLAIDASGDVFVADTGNQVIRKISASGTITTIAGNGILGYSGDGGPATDATLNSPCCVAVDASGNVYIADTSNYAIRKVSPTGSIATFAGTGYAGHSGDGGPASAASLNSPYGVAADANGNVYISDTGNGVVRKVSSSSTISIFAGNHNMGYSGDGGPATSAELFSPRGLSVDADGNVLIADYSAVRSVSTAGIITTIAGTGVAGFSGDGGSAIDARLVTSAVAAGASGTLYIAGNLRIRMIDSSRNINTVAGNGNENYLGDGGTGTLALLGTPGGIALAADGTLYIADTGNNRIRKISAAGTITTIAGNGDSGYSGDGGQATLAEMNGPSGVALDSSGNVYVVDTFNSAIRKIDSSSVITTVAGGTPFGSLGDGGPAASASLELPQSVVFDDAGNMYISQSVPNRVRRVTPDGIITTIAGTGTGGYSGDNGPASAAELYLPQGLAIDGTGNLYIADGGNRVIRKISTSGVISTVGSTDRGGDQTFGVAVDADGTIFVTDSYAEVRQELPSSPTLITIAGGIFGYFGDGGSALDAGMAGPQGIATGPNGVLYVADSYNNAIRVLTPDLVRGRSFHLLLP